MFLSITPRYRLLDLFGIPIYIDITFLFLLLFFAMSGATLAHGIAEAIILAFSVILHELGHSLTAQAFGYRTNDITISLIGGCASIIGMPRKAWQEFLTALAGPLVSFALSAVGFAILAFMPIENHWLADQIWYLTMVNFILGCFNLLPGFPMDGGRIFRSVLRTFLSRAKATFVAMCVGRVFAVLLGLTGLHAIIHGGPWGWVRIFIAWMIWQEGYREYRQALAEEDFRHWSQADFNARVSPPPYDL